MGKMLASRRTSVSEYKAAFDLIDRDAVEKESTLSISAYLMLKDLFDRYHRNGDGTVTAKDLGVVLREIGQNPSEEELHEMIVRV